MDCILEVGKTVKDCVRHAIQTTAAGAEKKTVYAVTGWKNINGKWMYLMPGDEEITVNLPDKMSGYVMERKWDPLDIQTAASLDWRRPRRRIMILLAKAARREAGCVVSD